MRVASLVPSATEALFALGLGDSVVAVTHECDWPAEALERPHLTRSAIPGGQSPSPTGGDSPRGTARPTAGGQSPSQIDAPEWGQSPGPTGGDSPRGFGGGLSPREVDAAVREMTRRGEAIYHLDGDELERLEPDLIVTQALCAVCAVSYDDVCSLAGTLPGAPRVLSLDPETLGEVLEDLVRLGRECGVAERGEALRDELLGRVARVESAVAGAPKPRVVALEWLDPPFIGGHWVPEMIDAAGGIDAMGEAGVKSRTATWEEIRAAEADVVLVMPCGLYADEAAEQAVAYLDDLRATGARELWAVDAASSFSRPGPRLVDGVELVAHLLHPELAEAPDGLGFRRL